ncbi:hypothetical protein D9M71_785070 [compost metagenome]
MSVAGRGAVDGASGVGPQRVNSVSSLMAEFSLMLPRVFTPILSGVMKAWVQTAVGMSIPLALLRWTAAVRESLAYSSR